MNTGDPLHGVEQKQSDFGPLSDSLAMSSPIFGTGGEADATTSGISLTTWAGHPGQFVNTAPFNMTATATAAANASRQTGIGVNSWLRREATWEFVRLDGETGGGSIVSTYRISYSATITKPRHETFTAYVGDNGGFVDQNPPIDANDNYVSGGGTVFASTPPTKIAFGSSANFFYESYASVQTDNYPINGVGQPVAGHVTGSVTSELWNLDVFDANGKKLTRFVDYDWYEMIPRPAEPVAATEPPVYDTYSAAPGVAFHAGDVNLDGAVDFADLLTLAKHYGQSGDQWTDGDLTEDGLVNFNDLLILAKNYGHATSAPGSVSDAFTADWRLAQSLAPEPASLLCHVAAGLTLLTRRPRSKKPTPASSDPQRDRSFDHN